MLCAFMVNYRNHTSLVVRRCTNPESTYNFVEIHGSSRLQIAVAALNNYAVSYSATEVGSFLG